jgi:dihydroxyacetone kinase-like protein
MKKLIDQPKNFVHESLAGLAVAHLGLLEVNFDPNFVYRADALNKRQGGNYFGWG